MMVAALNAESDDEEEEQGGGGTSPRKLIPRKSRECWSFCVTRQVFWYTIEK